MPLISPVFCRIFDNKQNRKQHVSIPGRKRNFVYAGGLFG